jgi:hypothetical protein
MAHRMERERGLSRQNHRDAAGDSKVRLPRPTACATNLRIAPRPSCGLTIDPMPRPAVGSLPRDGPDVCDSQFCLITGSFPRHQDSANWLARQAASFCDSRHAVAQDCLPELATEQQKCCRFPTAVPRKCRKVGTICRDFLRRSQAACNHRCAERTVSGRARSKLVASARSWGEACCQMGSS